MKIAANLLASSGANQRRPRQEYGSLFSHYDRFVGHRWYISASCSTGTHNDGNLIN